jgi:hypothetical protein
MANYIVCTLALSLVVVLCFSGALLPTFIGIVWAVLLYASGRRWPKFWRRFWVTNLRLLHFFEL